MRGKKSKDKNMKEDVFRMPYTTGTKNFKKIKLGLKMNYSFTSSPIRVSPFSRNSIVRILTWILYISKC